MLGVPDDVEVLALGQGSLLLLRVQSLGKRVRVNYVLIVLFGLGQLEVF